MDATVDTQLLLGATGATPVSSLEMLKEEKVANHTFYPHVQDHAPMTWLTHQLALANVNHLMMFLMMMISNSEALHTVSQLM